MGTLVSYSLAWWEFIAYHLTFPIFQPNRYMCAVCLSSPCISPQSSWWRHTIGEQSRVVTASKRTVCRDPEEEVSCVQGACV
ncbi:hypothetical protein FKM82_006324 [Ascaphus truei]